MAVEVADDTKGRPIDIALSLRAIPMKESSRRLQNQGSTACAPYLARQRCRGNDTYGITRNPFLLWLAGAGLWKERD